MKLLLLISKAIVVGFLLILLAAAATARLSAIGSIDLYIGDSHYVWPSASSPILPAKVGNNRIPADINPWPLVLPPDIGPTQCQWGAYADGRQRFYCFIPDSDGRWRSIEDGRYYEHIFADAPPWGSPR